jgi:hypothetical protein
MKDWRDDQEIRYLDESEAVYDDKYRNLSMNENIDRQERGVEAVQTKLRKYFVKPHQKMTPEETNDLQKLVQTSKDERAIHLFLKGNPFILTSKIHPAHHAQICISKPKLGAEFEPDFLMAGLDSAGLWWYGVELENPNKAMFTKAGEITAELNHALRQIDDWRRWLRENLDYLRREHGYEDIDGELPCYVVIGRRDTEVLDSESLLKRQREIMKKDKSGLFLHHYDWLLNTRPTIVDRILGKYVGDNQ